MAIATKHLFALNTKVLSVILLKNSGVIHLTFSHGSHQVRKLFQTYALMLYFFFFFFGRGSSSQPLVPMSNWQDLLVFCTSSYRVCFPKLLYSSLGTGQCVPLALHTKRGAAPAAGAEVAAAGLAPEEAASGASAGAGNTFCALTASQSQHALGFRVRRRYFWFD